MNISQKGIDLIKEFEGCRLKAYRDAVNVLTIGYGTTNADKDIIGVVIADGMVITQKIADRWLELSVNKKYSNKVSKYDNKYHFNQNQFDALVSFAYNIGSIDQLTQNGTRSIKEISEKILTYNKAGGKVLAGFTRRRQAEKKLFDTPVAEPQKEEKKETVKTTTKTLKKGAKVKIKSGATDLNTKKKYASFVYKNTYTIISVSGNNVVFGLNGAITGKCDKKYITLV